MSATILAVPNWSFGPDSALHSQFQRALDRSGLAVHYFAGDADHGRTVLAVRGQGAELVSVLLELAGIAFESIDLRAHAGVHPRIGALDVCPFVPLPETGLSSALEIADEFASQLAERFDVPVYMYELSHRGNHSAVLPELRRGGFEGLPDSELLSDFGPTKPHPTLGVVNVGVRGFLVAMNINLGSSDRSHARMIASAIRARREAGDPDFAGVRALGFSLESRGLTQVSLNLTLPDQTPPDRLVEHVERACEPLGVAIVETELIGVIRDIDLPQSSRLPVDPRQVVPWNRP